ncbi:MAG TPA: sigma-70 family RNA polymerase sigma factor [Phycisphaerae bacterium]|nr:sigma-70 family RNA polymerase sigma factor [Phycisphaerae bacterium]
MSDSPESLEELYRRTGPVVRAYLLRRVRDADAADELLQETFLAAARRPDQVAAAISSRAWLIGIAANKVREHVRGRRRGATLALNTQIAAARDVERDGRIDDMRAAIAELPELHCEALELRLIEDLSYAEIAAALAIPVGTVRSRIHNAVVRLRESLTAADTKS